MASKVRSPLAAIALLGALSFASCAEGRADDDGSHPGAPPEPPDPPADAGGGDAAPPDPAPARDTARFFLSGHSLTDDPTADDVVAIAGSLGLTAEYEEQIVVGSPIRYRTKGPDPNAEGFPGYHLGKNRDGFDMDVLAELADPQHLTAGARYDTLVITERHDLPMVVRWENTVGYLRDFHDHVVAANPDARTLLFSSWLPIRTEGVAYTPADWIAYEKAALGGWACVAAKVNLTLEAEGREDRVTVLPASGALVALVERLLADEVPGVEGTTDERLAVFFKDDVHMTPVGKYFMGLVIVAALYGRSPEGAAAPEELGLDDATVAVLQTLAATYVADYAARAESPTMAECRALFADTLCAPAALIAGTNDAAACSAFYADEDAAENPFR
jgi:hypothetical protein